MTPHSTNHTAVAPANATRVDRFAGFVMDALCRREIGTLEPLHCRAQEYPGVEAVKTEEQPIGRSQLSLTALLVHDRDDR